MDDLNQKMSIQTNMSRKEAELASMFLEGLKNKKEAQRDKIVTQLEVFYSFFLSFFFFFFSFPFFFLFLFSSFLISFFSSKSPQMLKNLKN